MFIIITLKIAISSCATSANAREEIFVRKFTVEQQYAWEQANPQYTSAETFEWVKYKNTIIITGFIGRITDIKIPPLIYGLRVTEIADRAFQGGHWEPGRFIISEYSLTSVTIPDTVISIGNSAFFGNRLTNLKIPTGVASIGSYAFANNQLTYVNLTGRSISIEGITLFENEIAIFDSQNEFIYVSFDIPSSLTSLERAVFAWNRLSEIIIPDGVIYIRENAFAGNQLTDVRIGRNVTYIGVGAFTNNQLVKVNIPDNVTHVRASAFENNQLIEIIIGGNVIEIGSFAFAYNYLTSIIFPNSVIAIGEEAFSGNQLDATSVAALERQQVAALERQQAEHERQRGEYERLYAERQNRVLTAWEDAKILQITVVGGRRTVEELHFRLLWENQLASNKLRQNVDSHHYRFYSQEQIWVNPQAVGTIRRYFGSVERGEWLSKDILIGGGGVHRYIVRYFFETSQEAARFEQFVIYELNATEIRLGAGTQFARFTNSQLDPSILQHRQPDVRLADILVFRPAISIRGYMVAIAFQCTVVRGLAW